MFSRKKQEPPPPTTAAASLKDDASSIRPYDLKGYERSFSISKTGCTRLAHVLQLNMESSTTTPPHFNLALLLRHVPLAFARVMRKHPMMRARVSKQDPLVCEIIPAMDVTDEQVQRDLVKLVPFDIPNGTEEQYKEQVRTIVQDTCNQTVDRTTQFPYFLTAVHDVNDVAASKSSTCTFILFSDHALSDIVSGMEVLKDLLDVLRLLVLIEHCQHQKDNTKQERLQKELDEIGKELPLRPPLYDSLRPPPSLWQRGSDAMITSFGENFLVPGIANFLPLLSARSNNEMKDVNGLPLPHNPSYCYMAVGKPGQCQAAVQKCQTEQVSITSAITAGVVVAYAKSSSSTSTMSTKSKFLMGLDLQYNDMRQRKLNQYPETPVGCHVFVAAQEVFSETGIDLPSLSFWKVAKLADTCAESTISSFNAMAEYTYTHHKFHASVPTLKLKANRGIIGDASLAYVEYPHPTTYDISLPSSEPGDSNPTFSIQGLHVYHSMPNVSYGAVIFITVVNDTFHYTLMSKLSEEDSTKLLQNIMSAVEGIPNMTADETMLQVVERL